MKKNYLFYCFILFGVVFFTTDNIMAQNHFAVTKNNKQTDNVFLQFLTKETRQNFHLLHPTFNMQNMEKPTKMQSRLMAYSVSEYDGKKFYLPQDSVRFFWSKNRNANIDLTQYVLDDLFFIPNSGQAPQPNEDYQNLFMKAKVDSIKDYDWDYGPGNFGNGFKTINVFDISGNIVSSTVYKYAGGQWINHNKTKFTYDAGKRITSNTEQIWNGYVWENTTKYLYDYEPGSNLEAYTISVWNKASGTWDHSNKTIFSYDKQNKNTNQIYQVWSTNSWLNSTKTSFDYNTDDQIISKAVQSWDNNSSQWEYATRTEYNFNPNKTADFDIEWIWNGNDWIEDYKYDYAFDSSRRNLNTTTFNWNVIDSNWAHHQSFNYGYSGNKITAITIADWDKDIEAFENNVRLLYRLNAYNQYTHLHLETWDSIVWKTPAEAPMLRFHYEEYDDSKIDDDDNSNINQVIAQKDFQVYPNPASDILNIKLKEGNIEHIKLMDITGKIVFQTNGNLNMTEAVIPTNQLANGVYILQIYSGEKTASKTISVQR